MNRYKVTLRLDGNWGEKIFDVIVYADNEDEAQDNAFDSPQIPHCRYEEDGGSYEQLEIEDVILMA